MSNLLVEDIDFQSIENEVEELQEGLAKVKNYYIKGPFLQSEVENHNKRRYPKPIIEREVGKHNILIAENRAMGELSHPQSSELNLDRVSHLVKELYMDGNTAMGKAKIIESTPCGKIAKALLENGIKLGVSSRGVGTLREGVVQNDFSLRWIDIVSSPSGPQCFVDGILESEKEWVLENGILTEKQIEIIEEQKEIITVETKFTSEERQAALLKLFRESLEMIAKGASKPYREGYAAGNGSNGNVKKTDNPYKKDPASKKEWDKGYDEGKYGDDK